MTAQIPAPLLLAARCRHLLAQLDFRTFNPAKPARLLDVACGQGFLIDYLAKNGWLDRVRYTGLDQSGFEIEAARRRWPDQQFDVLGPNGTSWTSAIFDLCVIQDLRAALPACSRIGEVDLVGYLLTSIWPLVAHGLAFVIAPVVRRGAAGWRLDDVVALCRRELQADIAIHWDNENDEMIVSAIKVGPQQRDAVPPAWLGPASLGKDVLTSSDDSLERMRKTLATNGSPASVTGCATFDYAPGRPNLYRLMRFKQGLVSALGVKAAFAVYRHTLSVPDCARLAAHPLQPERAYAVTRALVFHEVAPGGQRFVLEPPPVFGEGNHTARESVTRAFYVACLADARVRGRSAMIDVDGRALLDYHTEERNRLDDEIEWDPAIFFPDRLEHDSIWVVQSEREDCLVEIEEAFSLLGVHTDFFGDWMIEYLPKFVAARLSNRLASSVPILIDANMPEQHRESLELLFPREIELIEVPALAALRVRRLWIAPCLFYMPLHEKRNERFSFDIVAAPPHRFAPVLEELARRAEAALGRASPTKKIYLARRDFRHRRLVNRATIEALARERGFEIVFPEDFSFAEQVALVRGASHIVAPEGSAIFLVLFASRGARLCILSHPLTDPLADYNGLFSLREVSTVVLTGPIVAAHSQTPHDSDYRIDEEQFRSFVDEWLVDRPEALAAAH